MAGDSEDLERLVQAIHFTVLDLDRERPGRCDWTIDRLVTALGYDPRDVAGPAEGTTERNA